MTATAFGGLDCGLQGQEQRHCGAFSVEKKGSRVMGVLATLTSLSQVWAWPVGCPWNVA